MCMRKCEKCGVQYYLHNTSDGDTRYCKPCYYHNLADFLSKDNLEEYRDHFQHLADQERRRQKMEV